MKYNYYVYIGDMKLSTDDGNTLHIMKQVEYYIVLKNMK